MSNFIATADLVDILGPQARSCDTQFLNLGGHLEFCGVITTVTCFEDNGLVKQILNEPNPGGVLVVDGAGSLHTALMGDMIAKAGVVNGWSGVVINGAIRDSAVVATLEFGCKALGTNPRKSAKNAAGERDQIISLGGVDFIPGQFLYADTDGIIVATAPVQPPAR